MNDIKKRIKEQGKTGMSEVPILVATVSRNLEETKTTLLALEKEVQNLASLVGQQLRETHGRIVGTEWYSLESIEYLHNIVDSKNSTIEDETMQMNFKLHDPYISINDVDTSDE